MYPTIYDAVKDLFGISFPFLKLLQSFGFFVAIAFLLCAWVFAKELNRKDLAGLFPDYKLKMRKVIKGARLSQGDLMGNFLFAFLLGWKLTNIFIPGSIAAENPRGYVLSGQGNLIAGVIIGGLWAGIRWYIAERNKLPKPVESEERIAPAEHIGNMTLIAAMFGFLGAKIFHILENFGDFLDNPSEMLFSFSGLTMYGGLIMGGAAVLIYARKQGLNMLHVMDACAPGLFLAYGVGRLGCHVAGDGDWGIVNLSPKPGFIPQWLWAYDYPHNVNGVCNPFQPGTPEFFINAFCDFSKNPHLVAPVYPTPLYEALLNIIFFITFWYFIRKKISTPGMLFSAYLIFNGVERFFVELIRVNTTLFHIGSFRVTQAEFIAVILVSLGITGILYTKKRAAKSLA
jgi:prolipoprotein diacylglyceryl transferase